MEFSRPEYWSGLPFPPPGNLPHPGIEPTSPALAGGSLPLNHQGNPTVGQNHLTQSLFYNKSVDYLMSFIEHCTKSERQNSCLGAAWP